MKDATFLFYSLHTFLNNQLHVADMRLLFPEHDLQLCSFNMINMNTNILKK